MAAKFRSGLKLEIRVAVASRRGIPYSEVLGCALDVEEALPKNERITNPAPSELPSNFRDKRKWKGNRAPFENKRRFPTFRQPQNHGCQIVPQQRGNPQRTPYCSRCSKHHVGECRVGGIRCYVCGGNGHMSRECLNNNKGGVKNGQGQRPPQQPQPIRQVAPQQARAYALRGYQGRNPKPSRARRIWQNSLLLSLNRI
ncbi:serine/arginine-rich splicing factor RS2Z32-like [Salvia splendens]|uniref:serine/arginine-rich splicing factor RS2Z32-like n=1 Tax=Salvia splendens TaxID=180675 RepID=UPI001C273A73|nr:serine/arginine-rich splicing factor RS2Z32-like [Salvia splendens]